jgi:hypothetical protein
MPEARQRGTVRGGARGQRCGRGQALGAGNGTNMRGLRVSGRGERR